MHLNDHRHHRQLPPTAYSSKLVLLPSRPPLPPTAITSPAPISTCEGRATAHLPNPRRQAAPQNPGRVATATTCNRLSPTASSAWLHCSRETVHHRLGTVPRWLVRDPARSQDLNPDRQPKPGKDRHFLTKDGYSLTRRTDHATPISRPPLAPEAPSLQCKRCPALTDQARHPMGRQGSFCHQGRGPPSGVFDAFDTLRVRVTRRQRPIGSYRGDQATYPRGRLWSGRSLSRCRTLRAGMSQTEDLGM